MMGLDDEGSVCNVGRLILKKAEVGFMTGKEKKNWLKSNIGQFIKEYSRKAQRGVEPNDRKYDRKIEKLIKQMDPMELSALLHDNDEGPQTEAKDKSR